MRIAGICQWENNSIEKARDIKQNAHLYDKFVVYGQMEFATLKAMGLSDMLAAARSQNKKLICITGAASFTKELSYSEDIMFESYPTSYFTDIYCRFYGWDNHMSLYIQKLVDTFTHPFITLNYRAHSHRCEFIDLVYKNKLFDRNIIVWHNQINNHSGWLAENTYNFKYWNPKQLILEDDFTKTTNHYYIPDEYFKCFAQCVSESTEEAIIVSEKTVIPLFLRKPFLVATVKGFHKFLQELGFVLYDEIFDYSFDNIIDRTTRYDTMLQNFVKLNTLSLNELTGLYNSIYDKLEHNRLRAIEIGKNYLYASPTMLETINLQLLTNEPIDVYSYGLINRTLPVANQKYSMLHSE